MYESNNPYENGTVLTIYLIIGIGSIVFFLFGVCALLCCCQSRFRGVTRKGFVIRDVEPTQPLVPNMQFNTPVVIAGSYPQQGPPQQYAPSVQPHQQYPQSVPPPNAHMSQPQQAPPPYDTMPEKF